ncbi:GAF and ANTAR domain-containing protein [Nesterenkonia halotolerans]|uniref:Transcriptional regulator with GAF, ATPase, and Fis domain n=1 Tax=Nesterenkonia halotolerans TaxID=225325 RepID=A0ABR9J605_9MICC|nr:GAF and ANTAR domain-containing protein [Nesterenkonia halotolerans]MBE1514431.1 transcriptional regulator with GAF, ATPase, and Fis domain [Nesterenkonia halotolerans]
MADPYEVRDLSAELHQVLLEDCDLAEVLDSITKLAVDRLSVNRRVLCGIVLKRNRRNIVVASSSSEAEQLDEVQAGFDEGPCLEAQRTNTLIRVPDVRYETRWPRYMCEVRDHGLRSVLAVPLGLDETASAAINFYSVEPGAFNDEDGESAQRYAEVASAVVGIALRTAGHAESAEDRRISMESRTAIDLAAGIIMGQNRCSQEEAITILKSASNHRNIKLRTFAEQIIATVGHGPASTNFES